MLTMSLNRRLAAVLALVVAGCASPAEPQPLDLTLNSVVLTTAEQIEAWPRKPAIDANGQLQIRGFGLQGCGTLDAKATRSGRAISVAITAKGDYSPCPLSRWAWEPFSLVVDTIPPGVYAVRVRTVGFSDPVTATVRLD